MKYPALKIVMAIFSVFVVAGQAQADSATQVQDIIWADGVIYDTILTDTSFTAKRPKKKSVDVLYDFGMSGLQGQRPIADSSPMNKDYNGGRWDVKIVVFTTAGMAAHDPDGDGMVNFEIKDEATLLDHASRLGHFNIMDANVYFECPLIP